MDEQPHTATQNPLGNASLALGIVSLSLVFGLGLCALAGARQGWARALGTPLFICSASSAFLGLIAAALGLGGMLGRGKARAAAMAGLLLGSAGLCLFLAFLGRARALLGG
jgi:hypothetical protein